MPFCGINSLPLRTDDIIRLNKKQKQIQGRKAAVPRKQRPGVPGRLAAERRAGAPLHRGQYILFTFTDAVLAMLNLLLILTFRSQEEEEEEEG